jgi:hypothetical protein
MEKDRKDKDQGCGQGQNQSRGQTGEKNSSTDRVAGKVIRREKK